MELRGAQDDTRGDNASSHEDSDENRMELDEKEEETKAIEFPSSSQNYRFKAYKNLLGISFSFFITFGVYLAEIGLQSSVNEDNGLGLVSLCILYTFLCLSCVYSAGIIHILGTKNVMIIAYGGMTVYTLANFYPSWYTLIPGSAIIGLVFGPLWSSQGVHITSVAQQYALLSKKKSQPIVFLFFGIYVFVYKMSYVPSNIVSSVVLLNGRSSNTSIIDTASLGDVCNNTEAANLDRIYLYVLLSIYVVFDVVAIILLVLLVDRIGTDTKFLSISKVFHTYIKTPIVKTLKLFLSWKMNIIAIMMVLDGYSISFVFGLVTKFYVSDCIGVYWIGFFQTAFGIGSAVSAILNGYLAKIIPPYILVYVGVIVNVGTVSFLLIWERQPSYYIIFIVLLFWGYSEGIWTSMPLSLVGTVLSHKEKELTHSYCRMGNALGFIIGFLCAILFNTKVLLWIDLGIVLITLVSYSVLMFVTQPIHRLLPCCFKKQKIIDN